MGGKCGDDSVDGMKTKSKESEDEVFSDAVAEFSESVGPKKSMGDALDSSAAKMVVEEEISSSQTLKDKEVLGKFTVWDMLLAVCSQVSFKHNFDFLLIV